MYGDMVRGDLLERKQYSGWGLDKKSMRGGGMGFNKIFFTIPHSTTGTGYNSIIRPLSTHYNQLIIYFLILGAGSVRSDGREM